jgi:DNA primase
VEVLVSWLLSHGIDPEVAKRAGVHGTIGGPINFLYETPDGEKFYRERLPDGKMLQPKGTKLCLYWPLGRIHGGNVLLCEGEGDTLAAATILEKNIHPALNGLCPVGMPGVGAFKRAAAELGHYKVKNCYLALDADDAGRRATERLQCLLPQVGVTPFPITLPNGLDLSDYILSVGPGALRAAVSLAKPSALDPPQRIKTALRRQHRASQGTLRDIPASVYVSRLANMEAPQDSVPTHCPLHDDRTPSFVTKNTVWYCHGECGEGGGIYEFATRLWNCYSDEAHRRLREEFEGVTA